MLINRLAIGSFVGLAVSSLAGGAGAQPEVPTILPAREKITMSMKLKGDVAPLYHVTLRARATGTVSEIHFEEGDIVHAMPCEPIAILSSPDLEALHQKAVAEEKGAQAKLQDSQAELEIARQEVTICEAMVQVKQAELMMRTAERTLKEISADRREKLLEERAVTQEQVEESNAGKQVALANETSARAALAAAEAQIGAAKAKLEAAKSAVEEARAMRDVATAEKEIAATMLGFTHVTSPYPEAVVTGRHVDVGALIRADQTPIVTLMDVHQVRCQFEVPEEATLLVESGTPVRIRLSADPSRPFDAKVTRVSRHLDTKTRARRAEVVIDNPDGKLLPGMFLYAELSFDSMPQSVTLPVSVIIQGRGDPHVFVVEGNQVRRRNVILGIQDGHRFEIVGGLTGNERVIEKGLTGMREGDPVKVAEQ